MRALAIVGGVIAAALICVYAFTTPAQTFTAKPVVKVTLTSGHGSGFHIGKGYIVTAAHVVGAAEEVGIQSTDGQKRTATVLWANKAHDIALLRMEEYGGLEKARLTCRTPEVGEAVSAYGNPGNMEFLQTWGRISGSAREVGPWANVVVTDMVIVMGMSGGAVLDSNNKVVGMSVGVMVAPIGFAASLVGIGYIVPAEDICSLMGLEAWQTI